MWWRGAAGGAAGGGAAVNPNANVQNLLQAILRMLGKLGDGGAMDAQAIGLDEQMVLGLVQEKIDNNELDDNEKAELRKKVQELQAATQEREREAQRELDEMRVELEKRKQGGGENKPAASDSLSKLERTIREAEENARRNAEQLAKLQRALGDYDAALTAGGTQRDKLRAKNMHLQQENDDLKEQLRVHSEEAAEAAADAKLALEEAQKETAAAKALAGATGRRFLSELMRERARLSGGGILPSPPVDGDENAADGDADVGGPGAVGDIVALVVDALEEHFGRARVGPQVQSDAEELKREADALQGQLATLRGIMRAELQAVEAREKALREELERMRTELKAAKTAADGVAAGAGDTAGVDALQTRVSELETDVRELQTQKSTLEEELQKQEKRQYELDAALAQMTAEAQQHAVDKEHLEKKMQEEEKVKGLEKMRANGQQGKEKPATSDSGAQTDAQTDDADKKHQDELQAQHQEILELKSKLLEAEQARARADEKRSIAIGKAKGKMEKLRGQVKRREARIEKLEGGSANSKKKKSQKTGNERNAAARDLVATDNDAVESDDADDQDDQEETEGRERDADGKQHSAKLFVEEERRKAAARNSKIHTPDPSNSKVAHVQVVGGSDDDDSGNKPSDALLHLRKLTDEGDGGEGGRGGPAIYLTSRQNKKTHPEESDLEFSGVKMVDGNSARIMQRYAEECKLAVKKVYTDLAQINSRVFSVYVPTPPSPGGADKSIVDCLKKIAVFRWTLMQHVGNVRLDFLRRVIREGSLFSVPLDQKQHQKTLTQLQECMEDFVYLYLMYSPDYDDLEQSSKDTFSVGIQLEVETRHSGEHWDFQTRRVEVMGGVEDIQDGKGLARQNDIKFWEKVGKGVKYAEEILSGNPRNSGKFRSTFGSFSPCFGTRLVFDGTGRREFAFWDPENEEVVGLFSDTLIALSCNAETSQISNLLQSLRKEKETIQTSYRQFIPFDPLCNILQMYLDSRASNGSDGSDDDSSASDEEARNVELYDRPIWEYSLTAKENPQREEKGARDGGIGRHAWGTGKSPEGAIDAVLQGQISVEQMLQNGKLNADKQAVVTYVKACEGAIDDIHSKLDTVSASKFHESIPDPSKIRVKTANFKNMVKRLVTFRNSFTSAIGLADVTGVIGMYNVQISTLDRDDTGIALRAVAEDFIYLYAVIRNAASKSANFRIIQSAVEKRHTAWEKFDQLQQKVKKGGLSVTSRESGESAVQTASKGRPPTDAFDYAPFLHSGGVFTDDGPEPIDGEKYADHSEHDEPLWDDVRKTCGNVRGLLMRKRDFPEPCRKSFRHNLEFDDTAREESKFHDKRLSKDAVSVFNEAYTILKVEKSTITDIDDAVKSLEALRESLRNVQGGSHVPCDDLISILEKYKKIYHPEDNRFQFDNM